MVPKTPREYAMSFIAACDRKDADAYEQHVTRIARRWLRFMNSSEKSQGVVDSILEELLAPPPAGYGCAWDELRKRFVEWALRSDWLDANDRRLSETE
jgi:hypothetical protein